MSEIFAPEYKRKIVDAILRVNPTKPGQPVIAPHNITIQDPRPIALNDANTAIVVAGVVSEGIHGVSEYYYNRKTVQSHLDDLLHDSIEVDLSDVHLDTVTYKMLIDRINQVYGLYLVQSDFDRDLLSRVPMDLLVDHGTIVMDVSERSLLFYGQLHIVLRTIDLPVMHTMMDNQIITDLPEDHIDVPGDIVPPL